MEPEEANKELVTEKTEDIKNEGPMFHCDQSDTGVVDKIAQMLLPGLATACVDNTTGVFFASPGSVAAQLRKEMKDYLTQRSETFVAESIVLEGGAEADVSDDPYDIIYNFVDDFATNKRTLFGQVSTWMLSDQREDKIDDFAQEIEINGFWSTDKRSTLAQTLLKNIDFKTAFHCDEKFSSLEELCEEHLPHCKYRSITCQNEGCDAIFSACRLEDHDSICPFKFIPCEQKCSQTLMRRDMDRHCITMCPMRLVNCPFHSVGCQSAIPHCTIELHRSSNLRSHLLYILQGIYKEASEDDLQQRIEQLEKASLSDQLANARDIRSLTSIVKRLESKFGPMKFSVKRKDAVQDNIDNKDSSSNNNIENKDVNSNDTENRDVKAGNHVDNCNVNNHNHIKNQDGRNCDVESKDSSNSSKFENVHGTNNSNNDKNHSSNDRNIDIKDDGNSIEIENSDGTDSTKSSNIENKHVTNIGDIIESIKHGNNSNIENTFGNHIDDMENKQIDDSKIENMDVNNIGNIENKDGTNDNIEKHGSDNSNVVGSNSSIVENSDGSKNFNVEDNHGNHDSKVENRDVNNISSIANGDSDNINNIKKDANNVSNFDDKDENNSSSIVKKGGNNSHMVNDKHDSTDNMVDNGGHNNSIENVDRSSSNRMESVDSDNSKEGPSLANSSDEGVI